MIKDYYRLVVVIPVGPQCRQEYIEDSIASIQFYVQCSCKIILADDSQTGTGMRINLTNPAIDVVTTAKPMGKLCGLYVTLSIAFHYALEKYQFEALLRMDTDALIIGHDFETAAIEMFRTQPAIGMAGQYPFDFNGKLWDRSWPGGQLWRIFHTPYFFKSPLIHVTLLVHYIKAKRKGYTRGESVFGGVCFFSYQCLVQLLQNNLLPDHRLSALVLEEDHLFSLLVKSIGFQLGSLSGKELPMACAWRGMPASPQELSEAGKKIIHSTRFWKDMDEEAIRLWFRQKRLRPQKSNSFTDKKIFN